MKKSLIAMALMFGAVVFVMPSCGSDDNDEKTYTCTCENPSKTQQSGLNDAAVATYKADCATLNKPSASAASVKGAAVPKDIPKATATCN